MKKKLNICLIVVLSLACLYVLGDRLLSLSVQALVQDQNELTQQFEHVSTLLEAEETAYETVLANGIDADHTVLLAEVETTLQQLSEEGKQLHELQLLLNEKVEALSVKLASVAVLLLSSQDVTLNQLETYQEAVMHYLEVVEAHVGLIAGFYELLPTEQVSVVDSHVALMNDHITDVNHARDAVEARLDVFNVTN